MRCTFQMFLSGVLIASIVSGAQNADEYVREDGVLWKLENGRRFQVDPHVISVRLDAPLDDARSIIDEAAQEAGLDALHIVRSNRLGIHDLAIPEGSDPLEVVAALASIGRFEYVHENTFGEFFDAPQDPDFAQQWNLKNTGLATTCVGAGVAGADVHACRAWLREDGDPCFIIAVPDTGTDRTHQDLEANMWVNEVELQGSPGVDDDANGFVDDIYGWDFVGDDGDPMPEPPVLCPTCPLNPHGTAVASMAAAVGKNDVGIVGLAGGAKDGVGCKIMAMRIGDDVPATGVLDDAILYAVDNGAQVITLSLGVGQTTAIDDALDAADAAGVFVDCGTGNGFGPPVGYPAKYETVVAVTSTTNVDTGAAHSSIGPEVEVSAPGEGVYFAIPDDNYGCDTGTSYAAPQVGALAGLLWSAGGSLITHDQVRQIIKDSANDIEDPGWDEQTGEGRINAQNAIRILLNMGIPYVKVHGHPIGSSAGPPDISTFGGQQGVPYIGANDFGYRLENAPAQANGWWLIGTQGGYAAFAGGLIVVDLAPPTRVVPIRTDENGMVEVMLPISDDAGWLGTKLHAQFILPDHEAPFDYCISKGVVVTVGE